MDLAEQLKKNPAELKVTALAPARESSSNFVLVQAVSSLQDIPNNFHNNCSTCCLTAVHLVFHEPPLQPDTCRSVASSDHFKSNNNSVQKPVVNLEMPMAFKDTVSFECSNSVQIILSRSENKQRLPLFLSKKAHSNLQGTLCG